MSCEAFLATGDEQSLMNFGWAVGAVANLITVKGQTAFFTVFSENVETLFRAAVSHDVTLQQRLIQPGGKCEWHTIRQGPMAPWTPEPEAKPAGTNPS